MLQTVADVLGVTVKDLYNPFIETKNYLNNDDFELIEKVLKTVIEEIKNLKLEVTEVDLVNIMLEVFNYSKPEPKKELEKRFINWILQQRIQKK
ncbi:hypothetical protein [Candidatus Tisiphia endosymbiont of Nedyus quadrimaculatus]|uniref:hypothetical protein n=1 Tax=Candidatus Tisiphia endosymbiont of Nedyus quadrimaculatus TaxID=3139332 RepID=UPI00345E3121